MKKTLSFIDWDDTLFPTHWISVLDIDLDHPNDSTISLFSNLDLLICDLITNMIQFSTLIIVTNATHSWVLMCLNVLPNLKKMIDEKITSITSARDIFGEEFKHNDWKKITFKLFYNEHVSNSDTINRVLSFGDSEAEHDAVLELKSHQKNVEGSNEKDIVIGSIKFMRKPTLNQLVSQLQIVKILQKEIVEISHDQVFNLKDFAA
jgi:hypothetical protein